MIRNFSDYCRELNQCGFSMGGSNAKGIFARIRFDWTEQDTLDTPVKWHCGNLEIDPWEWQVRVLEERRDIAYAKVFFKTGGCITRDYYPYFYAVRRNGESFEEAYEQGVFSHGARDSNTERRGLWQENGLPSTGWMKTPISSANTAIGKKPTAIC